MTSDSEYDIFLKITQVNSNSDIAVKYLLSRGVTEDVRSKYSIGYFNPKWIDDKWAKGKWSEVSQSLPIEFLNFLRYHIKQPSITLPLYNEYGSLIGIQFRYIEEKSYNMYTLPNKPIKHLIYGLYQSLESIYKNKKILLVEGIFDFLVVQKYVPFAGALMTSTLPNLKHDILFRYADTIYLNFDSDTTGQMKAMQYASKFKNIKTLPIFTKYKDQSAFYSADKEGFEKYYKNFLEKLA